MVWMALTYVLSARNPHRTLAYVSLGHTVTCKAAALAVVSVEPVRGTEQNRTSAIIAQLVCLCFYVIEGERDREAQPAEPGLSLCGM